MKKLTTSQKTGKKQHFIDGVESTQFEFQQAFAQNHGYKNFYQLTKDRNYTVLNRSIVIHAKTDDLGRGGVTKKTPYINGNSNVVLKEGHDVVYEYPENKLRKESLKTGNAGSRIACGNIIKINE